MDVILWVLLLIGPFLLVQRSLHREIQAVFLLLVGRAEIAVALFSLLFFPGVLLHEASHYLAALLLGVRVGRVSLLPKVIPGPGGKASRLQLGYVETGKADPVRDSLIGAAPLLVGGLAVIFIGLSRLDLGQFSAIVFQLGNNGGLAPALTVLTQQPDFWLWFYLLFTISGTMMPSASDRRAWLTVALFAGLIVALALLAGAGPWLAQNLAPYLSQALEAFTSALSISLVVQLALLLPVFFLHRLLSKATGLDVA